MSKKRRPLQEMAINITPLMDVLTVLLFFLVKIFTISSMDLTSFEDVHLPTLPTAHYPPEEAVTLAIGTTQIKTADGVISQLTAKKDVTSSDLDEDGKTIKALLSYLQKQMDKRNEIFSNLEDKSLLPPGKLMLQVDKDIPFQLIKKVLYTAGQVGYKEFQLLSEKEE